MKYDDGKPPIHLVPTLAIESAARVLEFGAKKYGENNWRDDINTTEWSRSYSSLQRHLMAYWNKEDIDPESGLLHLDHALTQLIILRVAYEEGKDMDDRYEVK
tara:strand:- start:387 stop:695 length:309 start_codon:yes stop_codon:yes gene_type:complete